MIRPEPMRGVYAPILTPMHEDYSPDIERWVDHAHWLLENGCHGLAPFGTTSEATSFSVEERIDALDRLVKAGIPAAKLIVGVGCSAFTDTVRLAAHAADLGSGGVLMLPPFYYKGVSDEGIFRAVAEVIERVADDRLRVYLYHIPPIAHVGYSLPLIERLVSMFPQTVVGIKDSSGDGNNLQAILDRFFAFGTFAGSEKFLLQTLRNGGAGTISAMANIIPGPIRALYDAWQRPEAERMQAELNALREALKPYPVIPSLKEIVARWRNDDGWRTVRPPLVSMPLAQAEEMFALPAVAEFLAVTS
jgi:4-hydroxy-tetrahydrodipicolinate synthase